MTRNSQFNPVAYTDEWIETAFLKWYSSGKPGAESLILQLEPPFGEIMPKVSSMSRIIRDQFIPRALELDTEVASRIETELIQEKVEMFRRHTEIAVELQDKALKFLRDEGIKDSNTALKALLSAVELEKASRGIDRVLESVGTRTDEQLMDELRKLISNASSVEFLPEETPDAPE